MPCSNTESQHFYFQFKDNFGKDLVSKKTLVTLYLFRAYRIDVDFGSAYILVSTKRKYRLYV